MLELPRMAIPEADASNTFIADCDPIVITQASINTDLPAGLDVHTKAKQYINSVYHNIYLVKIAHEWFTGHTIAHMEEISWQVPWCIYLLHWMDMAIFMKVVVPIPSASNQIQSFVARTALATHYSVGHALLKSTKIILYIWLRYESRTGTVKKDKLTIVFFRNGIACSSNMFHCKTWASVFNWDTDKEMSVPFAAENIRTSLCFHQMEYTQSWLTSVTVSVLHHTMISFLKLDGATPLEPQIAATMSLLWLFYIANLHGWIMPTDFCHTLKQMTCGDELSVPLVSYQLEYMQ